MQARTSGLLTPLERPAVVLDCGTGFTKLGFAGNAEVRYIKMAWTQMRLTTKAT